MKNVITYKGELTFKILHGDKVVKTFNHHNEGTKILMDFLVNCLGSLYDKQKAPKYLRLYYSSSSGMPVDLVSSEVTIRPIVTNFSPSYPDYAGAKSGVVLTFLIPSTLIKSTNNRINKIALYDSINRIDGNRGNYMAWVELASSEEIQIQGGESLMILWEMTLENKVVNN